MPVIKISLEGDEAWSDLRALLESDDPRLIQAMGEETRWQFVLLKGGMMSGDYSVGLRLDLPDGRHVVAETSWNVLSAAFGAMRARVEG